MKIAAAALAFVALFLIVNKGAYEGYFSDDDLDNIAWTRHAEPATFPAGLVSPRYYPNHFRPVGHWTYRVLGSAAGLEFPRYVRAIHALHLANAMLVWWLLARIGVPLWPAAGGVLVFGFHMALFDALWKPMYLFDLWSGFFSILTLIFWVSKNRWGTAGAFVCFWLAVKSKELAVMLPFALAAYEYFLGERRWRRLIPFFAVSAMFAAQAMWQNRQAEGDYRLQFAPWALWRTVSFYSSKVLRWPYAGLALLVLAVLVRDRRVRFGVAWMCLMLAPVLGLPTKLSGAYLYVPAMGLAVAAGALFATRPRVGGAALLLWLGLNFQWMREQRKAELTIAHENRAYAAQVFELARTMPEARRFVYDRLPAHMNAWGLKGALALAYGTQGITMIPAAETHLAKTFEAGEVTLLVWDAAAQKLGVVSRAEGGRDASYLKMDRSTPVWQLEEGWYPLEHGFRWTKPAASARLWRPAAASTFEIEVNVGPQYIADVKTSRTQIRIDGEPIGVAEFTAQGWQKRRFRLAPKSEGPARVEIISETPYHPARTDPRALGAAVAGFGFVNEAAPRGPADTQR